VIINTAAMHNLDTCEQEPVRSFQVNAVGALNLARLSNEMDAMLIHISTDYVFDGKAEHPYLETDLPRPINVYGNTKLSGEHFIQSTAHKYAIVRVSGLYGKNPCRAKGGLNFVQLMLKLAKERDEVRVVDDEVLTPTSTKEVAAQVVCIVNSGATGLFHATCQGQCSWHGFARAIFDQTGARVKLSVADPEEFPTKVPRPKYSVLKNHRLKGLGVDAMPHWKEALVQYLDILEDSAP